MSEMERRLLDLLATIMTEIILRGGSIGKEVDAQSSEKEKKCISSKNFSCKIGEVESKVLN